MAASMFTTNSWLPSLFLFYFVLTRTKCQESMQPKQETNSSSIADDRVTIFSELLNELYAHETQLHRCTYRIANDCFNNNTSQSHFNFPSVKVLDVDQMCNEKNIYECLKTDTTGKQLLNTVGSDVNKTVDDVCCSLEKCGHLDDLKTLRRRNDHEEQLRPSTKTTVPDNDRWEQICTNCSVISDVKHGVRLEILQNTTCTKETFRSLPCRELNIIALNVLSSKASSNKLQDDAKDIIKHCNPGFFMDPLRTFTALTRELSDKQLSSLSNIFFTEDTDQVKRHPGKSFGIFVLVVAIIISLAIFVWLIRTRIFKSRSVPKFSPNISYSRIDYNDDALEDYSDEEDGENSIYVRA